MLKPVLKIGAALALAAAALAPALTFAQALDLSRYSMSAKYTAGVGEASGITYNWDNDSLMIVGDNVNAAERTKTGQLYSYPLLGTSGSGSNAFKDTEGIAYMGNGKYLLADERAMSISVITGEATWDMGGGLTRTAWSSKPDSPTYTFGPTSPNLGIEGVAFERSTGKIFTVKEAQPEGIYEANISFGATTATTTGSHFEMFDPAVFGAPSLSDIAVLSNSSAFAGKSFADHLLVLSASAQRLYEVTRGGVIVSSLDLTGMATKIEGVTIDNDGVIYMVAESGGPGGGSALVVLTAPVPEPETYALMLAGLGLVGFVARRRRAARKD